MGRLYEDAAAPLIKPMMRDQVANLSPQDQTDITRWIIKTTLLLGIRERVSSRKPYEWARALLIGMARDGTVPPGSSVRIGRFTAGLGADSGNDAPLVDLMPGGAPPPMNLYTVITLAHFAFELVMPKSSDSLEFIARTAACHRLVRIWPPRIGGAEFPPPESLTASDIALLRSAYDDAMPHGVRIRYAAGENLPGGEISSVSDRSIPRE